jgi:hypothetical protein
MRENLIHGIGMACDDKMMRLALIEFFSVRCFDMQSMIVW